MASISLPSPYISPCVDDSASSYLTLIRESFSSELTNSTLNTNCSSFQIKLNRKGEEDGELDIFGAEKYFSGRMDAADFIPIPKKIAENRNKIEENSSKKSKSRSGSRSTTCSDRSENSQNSLIRSRWSCLLPPSTAGEKPSSGSKKFLGIFRYYCTQENAVEVDGDCSSSFNPGGEKDEVGSSLRGGLTSLTSVKEDSGSESSSDLFEIESLANKSRPFYEPSEASIEWSIATASAGNFSTASDWSAEHQTARGREGRKSLNRQLLLGWVGSRAVKITAEKRIDERRDLNLERRRAINLATARPGPALSSRSARGFV